MPAMFTTFADVPLISDKLLTKLLDPISNLRGSFKLQIFGQGEHFFLLSNNVLFNLIWRDQHLISSL